MRLCGESGSANRYGCGLVMVSAGGGATQGVPSRLALHIDTAQLAFTGSPGPV
jgi:hypothetical protein